MNIDLLARLSNAFGPSGLEDEPREILRSELLDYADEIKVDSMGNIYFYYNRKDGDPTVLIDAHTDEVGFIATFLDDKGFLKFSNIGGIVPSVMQGQSILLKGKKGYVKGVVGSKPPHVLSDEERKKVVSVEELFIDIGVGDREQAEEMGCYVGMMGVFDVKFSELGNGYVRGKAFDDRAGCYVMAEAFKALKDSKCNVVAVGAVQEEVGLRGTRVAAWKVDPDYALALEGTFAVDVPGVSPENMVTQLKKGPILTIADRGIIVNPKVLQILVDTAEAGRVPYQFKKPLMGGTDASAIHLVKGGIPTGVVSVPCRYIHAPASIAHIEDLDNSVNLVKAFVNRISSL
jgi:putative aminopeptidase FrvX